jgi:hypothetical protein
VSFRRSETHISKRPITSPKKKTVISASARDTPNPRRAYPVPILELLVPFRLYVQVISEEVVGGDGETYW